MRAKRQIAVYTSVILGLLFIIFLTAPTSASAQTIITSAGSYGGGDYKLGANITVAGDALTFGGEAKLDLNGYTIRDTTTGNVWTYGVTGNGKLTLYDSSGGLGKVTGFRVGVKLNGANSKIIGVNLSGNRYMGVWVEGSGSKIIGGEMSNIDGVTDELYAIGVQVGTATDVEVSGVLFRNLYAQSGYTGAAAGEGLPVNFSASSARGIMRYNVAVNDEPRDHTYGVFASGSSGGKHTIEYNTFVNYRVGIAAGDGSFGPTVIRGNRVELTAPLVNSHGISVGGSTIATGNTVIGYANPFDGPGAEKNYIVQLLADTEAPTVSITTPANGSTVSGTIPVSANAFDNVGVAGVQFKLDGTNLGAEDTTSPYSISWNTTPVTDGSHILSVVARDAAGQTTTAANVAVTVSNAAPAATTTPYAIINPADIVIQNGTEVILANNNLSYVGSGNISQYRTWYVDKKPSSGSYYFEMRVDAVGTVDPQSQNVSIIGGGRYNQNGTKTGGAAYGDPWMTGDVIGVAVGPFGTWFSKNGVWQGGASLQEIDAGNTTHAAAGPTSYPFKIYVGDMSATTGSYTSGTLNFGQGSISGAAYHTGAGGSFVYEPPIGYIALGTSGGATTTSPDTTAPTVSISYPANGATVSGSICLSANASDNVGVVGVQFNLDGNNAGSEDTTSPYCQNYLDATAGTSTHTLFAVARDAAGNIATSSSITFIVDNTVPPVVTYAAINPAEVIIQSGSAVVLSNNNLSYTGSGNIFEYRTWYVDKKPSSGSYYFEMRVDGVGTADTGSQNVTAGSGRYNQDGTRTGGAAYGSAWSTGDIIGVAVSPAGTWFSKNGVWQNGATLAEIEAGNNSKAAGSNTSYPFRIYLGDMSATTGSYTSGTFNFGQGSIPGTTYYVDAGGNFKYVPPAGFKAISSANVAVREDTTQLASALTALEGALQSIIRLFGR
ncbi:hypothetical protein HY414_00950 [Candidatus Kaiserbacteria bacterium]|nr:hypothetical protein [Candidatus Kaiserbacteria bacterium]